MSWTDAKYRQTRTLHERDLKLCDLCGALNLVNSSECVTCSWHGTFERNPVLVRAAMDVYEYHNGRLSVEAIASTADLAVAYTPTFFERMRLAWHRVVGRMRAHR
jgi:hypothetical protein